VVQTATALFSQGKRKGPCGGSFVQEVYFR
jgi:hypothetical protein